MGFTGRTTDSARRRAVPEFCFKGLNTELHNNNNHRYVSCELREVYGTDGRKIQKIVGPKYLREQST